MRHCSDIANHHSFARAVAYIRIWAFAPELVSNIRCIQYSNTYHSFVTMRASVATVACLVWQTMAGDGANVKASQPLLRPDVGSSYIADVVVYGSTPAGIAAAIAASNGGVHSVLIVEPLLFIGGMGAAGGLGLNDQQVSDLSLITGIARQWCNLNGEVYQPGNTTYCVHHPDNYVSEDSYFKMLSAAGVSVATGCYAVSTLRNASSPLQIATLSANCTLGGGASTTVFTARSVVIDASYDGDVMVVDRGIDYTWGREANTTYNEPMAGVFLLQEDEESFQGFQGNISATVDGTAQGALLAGIEAGPVPAQGSGDDRLMAFQHRACVTKDTNNRVPFYAPPGYNRSDFALLQGVLEGLLRDGHYPDGPPLSYFGASGSYAPAVGDAGRHKTIMCCGAGAVMSDPPGLNRGWANASYEGRQAMIAAHTYYLQGMLYYLANDPAVPGGTRADASSWGLCADEWPTASPPNWPPQLYIRVSNRLQGDYVMTQNNMMNQRSKNDSVSCAVWELDSHITSRWAVANPWPGPGKPALVPLGEGFFRHSPNTSVPQAEYCGTADGDCDPTNMWYDVSYRVMLPKRSQASNLLVPVAISASAVAYTSARIETMFMDLGAAAGVAARMVIAAGGSEVLAVQDVNVSAVQEVLVGQYGQRIRGPF